MADSKGFAAIGTYVKVSADAPATTDTAGFSAISTYVDSDEGVSLSEIGATANIISYDLLKSGTKVKRRGVNDSGTLNCSFAYDSSNELQALLTAKQASGETVSVAEVLPNGDVLYFQAIVQTATSDSGSSAGASMFNANLAITGDIFLDIA